MKRDGFDGKKTLKTSPLFFHDTPSPLEMAFTEGSSPAPTETTTYSTPSHSDLAAVAATVSVVGIFMAALITWLVVRLRRTAESQSQSIPVVVRRPTSTASYTFRPSFAPSEASSKFGFSAYLSPLSPLRSHSPVRKPLRLSRPHEDGSWDFADPDPFSQHKESPFDPPSLKRRPAPLSPVPAYSPRAHRAKDDFSPRTPTTPTTPAVVEPPPAYCRGPPSPSSPC